LDGQVEVLKEKAMWELVVGLYPSILNPKKKKELGKNSRIQGSYKKNGDLWEGSIDQFLIEFKD
jgi:hypothetical protein